MQILSRGQFMLFFEESKLFFRLFWALLCLGCVGVTQKKEHGLLLQMDSRGMARKSGSVRDTLYGRRKEQNGNAEEGKRRDYENWQLLRRFVRKVGSDDVLERQKAETSFSRTIRAFTPQKRLQVLTAAINLAYRKGDKGVLEWAPRVATNAGLWRKRKLLWCNNSEFTVLAKPAYDPESGLFPLCCYKYLLLIDADSKKKMTNIPVNKRLLFRIASFKNGVLLVPAFLCEGRGKKVVLLVAEARRARIGFIRLPYRTGALSVTFGMATAAPDLVAVAPKGLGSVHLWHVCRGTRILTLRGMWRVNGEITALRFSSSGMRLVVVVNRTKLYILSVPDLRVISSHRLRTQGEILDISADDNFVSLLIGESCSDFPEKRYMVEVFGRWCANLRVIAKTSSAPAVVVASLDASNALLCLGTESSVRILHLPTKVLVGEFKLPPSFDKSLPYYVIFSDDYSLFLVNFATPIWLWHIQHTTSKEKEAAHKMPLSQQHP